jgi:hypothetical protein
MIRSGYTVNYVRLWKMSFVISKQGGAHFLVLAFGPCRK